ncbi:hypothetical protein [Jannaschia rubra]|nr:hypothetical protein [Jannaschia rubra]
MTRPAIPPAPHPDILVARAVPWDRLARGLSGTLGLPASHVIRGALPADADYDALFDRGYLVVGRYPAGTFEWIAQGMMRPGSLTDDAMRALAAALGTVVCLDRSVRDAEPDVTAYTPDAVHPGISVAEREDRDGETFLTSRQVERLIEGNVGRA